MKIKERQWVLPEAQKSYSKLTFQKKKFKKVAVDFNLPSDNYAIAAWRSRSLVQSLPLCCFRKTLAGVYFHGRALIRGPTKACASLALSCLLAPISGLLCPRKTYFSRSIHVHRHRTELKVRVAKLEFKKTPSSQEI